MHTICMCDVASENDCPSKLSRSKEMLVRATPLTPVKVQGVASTKYGHFCASGVATVSAGRV